MEWQQESDKLGVSEATVRSASKRRTAMKILIYLQRENIPLTIGEVSEGLDILYETANYSLNKLMECNFIIRVEDRMDGRTRYFQIDNKEVCLQATKLYKKMVGFKLARLVIPIPGRISSEELKLDVRFINRCKFFGLEIQEGIELVATCPKINSQSVSDHSGKNRGFYFSRKENEGYEKPEEEKSERKPSIGLKQTEPEDI